MKKIISGALYCLLLFIYSASSLFVPTISDVNKNNTSIKCYTGIEQADIKVENIKNADIEVGSRFFELFFGKKRGGEEILLYPGGDAFGILINEEGVTVTEVTEGTRLHIGDRIIGINGAKISAKEDVEKILSSSCGEKLSLSLIRDNENISLSVLPKKIDGEYRLGVKLRSETAGIGTITFIDEKGDFFGGLGHGITDSTNDGYITIKEASVLDVTLGGCKRGEPGRAGELTGVLKREPRGTIYKNCECGVFGTFSAKRQFDCEPLAITKKEDVKCGSAKIISTVKNGYKEYYDIEIYDIDTSSEGSKSFKIKVQDPALIAITGGIVRGMSGSPIIQNGKLVGAVTHVMLNDPTEGYGIFIENMLNASDLTRNKLPMSA